MPAAISERPHLVLPARSRKPLRRIAQWTLYVAGAFALLLGLLVWPGNVHAAGNTHAFAGWLVIVSLWTLAGSAARAKVSRSVVWLAVGWGLATALAAAAQYQLRPGSWITWVHIATGVGALVWGQTLLTRMRHADIAVHADEHVAPSIAIKDAASQFLANKRIAVTGVSRHAQDHGSNIVYRRLRERGYEVFAVNPNVSNIEGDPSYASVSAIPGGVDAVVIATSPKHAMGTMRECADLGIKHVWMHRLTGTGSVSQEAAAWGRQRGIRVIDGGCPLMFEPVSDPGHKLMKSVFTLTGKVPRHV